MSVEKIEIKWAWDHPIVQEILLKYYRERLFCSQDIADKIVKQILALTSIEPPGQVLDIGCGLGYHAISFARRGFEVFAFDPGNRYIDIATKHISDACVKAEIKQMACKALKEKDQFDLAWAGWYCPGQLSPLQVTQDFSRIRQALVPGGWFVSTVAGWPKVSPSDKVRNWTEMKDCFVLTEKWSDETFYNEHSMFVYPIEGKVIRIIEVERMYGLKEIVPLLESAGFTEIETFETLSKEAPAQEGKHFVFLCRRQEA
jgi:SAM-dependent methyltransferase